MKRNHLWWRSRWCDSRSENTLQSRQFAEIILLEKGKYISYANCGLPYYIGVPSIQEQRETLHYRPQDHLATDSTLMYRVCNEGSCHRHPQRRP